MTMKFLFLTTTVLGAIGSINAQGDGTGQTLPPTVLPIRPTTPSLAPNTPFPTEGTEPPATEIPTFSPTVVQVPPTDTKAPTPSDMSMSYNMAYGYGGYGGHGYGKSDDGYSGDDGYTKHDDGYAMDDGYHTDDHYYSGVIVKGKSGKSGHGKSGKSSGKSGKSGSKSGKSSSGKSGKSSGKSGKSSGGKSGKGSKSEHSHVKPHEPHYGGYPDHGYSYDYYDAYDGEQIRRLRGKVARVVEEMGFNVVSATVEHEEASSQKQKPQRVRGHSGRRHRKLSHKSVKTDSPTFFPTASPTMGKSHKHKPDKYDTLEPTLSPTLSPTFVIYLDDYTPADDGYDDAIIDDDVDVDDDHKNGGGINVDVDHAGDGNVLINIHVNDESKWSNTHSTAAPLDDDYEAKDDDDIVVYLDDYDAITTVYPTEYPQDLR
mmetsp:Transcript_26807/g.53549  ORF Transcript_26807/g.53549 Transcript_26807/m.53549 type:complete len:429 (+) Transcript_26807:224-1510(+)